MPYAMLRTHSILRTLFGRELGEYRVRRRDREAIFLYDGSGHHATADGDSVLLKVSTTDVGAWKWLEAMLRLLPPSLSFLRLLRLWADLRY